MFKPLCHSCELLLTHLRSSADSFFYGWPIFLLLRRQLQRGLPFVG
jgi:hypothetical protein